MGASGGGKAYRQRRPMNFYGVVTLVCVLGVLSIAWARYDYRKGINLVEPTVGTTWYAGNAIDICGNWEPSLAPNVASGFSALANGVIKIAPVSKSQAGSNAKLSKFVDNYAGFEVTSSKIALPGVAGKPDPLKTYTNGQTCPKGTKDAGKAGQVKITYWPTYLSTQATSTTNTGSVQFSPNMVITFGFVPSGTTLPKPPQYVQKALVSASLSTSTTTTTSGSSTTSTSASTSTTTKKR